MKNKPCKELQAVGRDSSGRKHAESDGCSEDRRKVGPHNDYCSKKQPHKSKNNRYFHTYRALVKEKGS